VCVLQKQPLQHLTQEKGMCCAATVQGFSVMNMIPMVCQDTMAVIKELN